MKFVAEVRIELKKGVMDAEGETVQKSLKLLGFPVERVRAIKAYEILIDAGSKKDAEKKVGDICKRLLANPVIQNYLISVKNA